MRAVWALAALLALPGMSSGQTPVVLRVTVTLADASQTPAPVARHALLISDNPASAEPRRVLTGPDGTVEVRLRPGLYTVESDRPFPFLGKAYQWTEMVEVVAGRGATLALTSGNAEVVPWTAGPSASTDGAPARDPALLFGKWQESVVAVWSPTSRGSGFVVDPSGLIATDRHVVGQATLVEVQVSPARKVAARVVASEGIRDVAIIQVDPRAISGRAPLPLPCPPATAPALDDGQEIVALGAPLRAPPDVVSGEVIALHPRTVETDLRLSFGGAGGPIFDGTGALVGLTSVPYDAERRRGRDVNLVRSVSICEALAAAQPKMAGTAPPEPIDLPVDPTRPYPFGTTSPQAGTGRSPSDTEAPAASSSEPPVVSSSDFEVAFLTPPMMHRAQQRADWTGGRSGRSPEAEARIGRLTDFGAWSDYFADLPAVLAVRVTPKLVEGFWKRLGREAARTQGAELPAFKDFKGDFLRLRASCGGREVAPIHPFVIEHRLSEKNLVREGLYVFDPGALGPECGTVTLALSSEAAPAKADTIAIPANVIERLWQDFAPFRAASPEP